LCYAELRPRCGHLRMDRDGLEPVREEVDSVRLRARFLVPLFLVLLAIVVLFIGQMYAHERGMVAAAAERAHRRVLDLYTLDVGHELDALDAILTTINFDSALRKALANGDRDALSRLTQGLFGRLQADAGMSSLCFSAPDRVSILRLHLPARHGDIIDQPAMQLAERTGRAARGVELNPQGTFTLRVVQPWYENQGHPRKLIGFVGLGTDLDRVMDHVHDITHMPLFLLIDKRYLKRPVWERTMRRLGRRPDWDQFQQVVLGSTVGGDMPAQLEEVVRTGELASTAAPGILNGHDKVYGVLAFSISDASGREEGKLVALVDLSQPAHLLRRAMIIGGAVALASGAGLLAAFWFLIGRVETELGRSRVQLRLLATHDGLTGLYNHRMLYANLDEEVARAGRYAHPVSLLMLDIDWFKRVNDEYGHVAGDSVLRELARRVMNEGRIVDSVYRYGGEEIAVLLPETGASLAEAVAERMRVAVAGKPFVLDNGHEITVTVSIGVAEFPAHVTTADELVVASDEALYSAKNNGRNQVQVCARVPA